MQPLAVHDYSRLSASLDDAPLHLCRSLYGQFPLFVIPHEAGELIASFLVVVGKAVVVIEDKRGVGAGEDQSGDRLALLCVGVLDYVGHRNDRSGLDEERQTVDGHWQVEPLSALVAAARPIVIPLATTGQIDPARRRLGHRMRHGADENGAEEILILQVEHCAVVGKVKGQGACHGVVAPCLCRCHAVDIRQQAVAQAYHPQDGIVVRSAGLTEAPDLAGRVAAMGAEHRQEGGPLKHAHVVFAIGLVVYSAQKLTFVEPSVAVVACEERAHVDRPVRIAGGHIVQSGWYLLAERSP